MNRKLLSLALIAAVLLSGCTAENENTETAVTTVQTIAPNVVDCELIDYTQFFDTYEEMAAAVSADNPDVYIHPMPEIPDTWQKRIISYDPHLEYYSAGYTAPPMRTITSFSVDYNERYDSLDQYIESSYISELSEVVEKTDSYVIYLSTDGRYTAYGLLGDNSTGYFFTASNSSSKADQLEILKQFMAAYDLT